MADNIPPQFDGFSAVDDILRKRAAQQNQQEKAVEKEKEFKDVVARLSAIPDFQFFLENMIKYCGVYKDDQTLNAAQILRDNGKKAVYLSFVRPYLPTPTKEDLEKQ